MKFQTFSFGDFIKNTPIDDTDGNKYRNYLTAFAFEIWNFSSARAAQISKSCLDHAITPNFVLIDTIKRTINNHFTVNADLVLRQNWARKRKRNTDVNSPDLNNLKNDRVLNFLFLTHGLGTLPESAPMNSKVEILAITVTRGVDKRAPENIVKRLPENEPWTRKEIENLSTKLNKLLQKGIENPSAENPCAYKQNRKRITNLLKNENKHANLNRFCLNSTPKTLYTTCKKKTKPIKSVCARREQN